METPLYVILKEKGHTVYFISQNVSGYECAQKLSELKIGALVVMDGESLVGIVSERDLLNKALALRKDPDALKVKDIMTKKVLTAEPSMTVQAAMRLITEKRLRHLPVLEEGKLVGLISIGDITRWVMLQQEKEIAALTGYIHGNSVS